MVEDRATGLLGVQRAVSSPLVLEEGRERRLGFRLDGRKDLHRAASRMRQGGAESMLEVE